MRIGPHVIDTDWMTAEDVSVIITELRRIRHRKLQAESLQCRMNELLAEARENNFTFVNEYTGSTIPQDHVNLIDVQ